MSTQKNKASYANAVTGRGRGRGKSATRQGDRPRTPGSQAANNQVGTTTPRRSGRVPATPQSVTSSSNITSATLCTQLTPTLPTTSKVALPPVASTSTSISRTESKPTTATALPATAVAGKGLPASAASKGLPAPVANVLIAPPSSVMSSTGFKPHIPLGPAQISPQWEAYLRAIPPGQLLMFAPSGISMPSSGVRPEILLQAPEVLSAPPLPVATSASPMPATETVEQSVVETSNQRSTANVKAIQSAANVQNVPHTSGRAAELPRPDQVLFPQSTLPLPVATSATTIAQPVQALHQRSMSSLPVASSANTLQAVSPARSTSSVGAKSAIPSPSTQISTQCEAYIQTAPPEQPMPVAPREPSMTLAGGLLASAPPLPVAHPTAPIPANRAEPTEQPTTQTLHQQLLAPSPATQSSAALQPVAPAGSTPSTGGESVVSPAVQALLQQSAAPLLAALSAAALQVEVPARPAEINPGLPLPLASILFSQWEEYLRSASSSIVAPSVNNRPTSPPQAHVQTEQPGVSLSAEPPATFTTGSSPHVCTQKSLQTSSCSLVVAPPTTVMPTVYTARASKKKKGYFSNLRKVVSKTVAKEMAAAKPTANGASASTASATNYLTAPTAIPPAGGNMALPAPVPAPAQAPAPAPAPIGNMPYIPPPMNRPAIPGYGTYQYPTYGHGQPFTDPMNAPRPPYMPYPGYGYYPYY